MKQETVEKLKQLETLMQNGTGKWKALRQLHVSINTFKQGVRNGIIKDFSGPAGKPGRKPSVRVHSSTTTIPTDLIEFTVNNVIIRATATNAAMLIRGLT